MGVQYSNTNNTNTNTNNTNTNNTNNSNTIWEYFKCIVKISQNNPPRTTGVTG
jgi:hypothetical protein